MKIKFNSDDGLPLKTMLELYNMGNITQPILDECLYKLQMLEHDTNYQNFCAITTMLSNEHMTQ